MTDIEAQPVRELEALLCLKGEPTPKGYECHFTGEACVMEKPEWWNCEVYKRHMGVEG